MNLRFGATFLSVDSKNAQWLQDTYRKTVGGLAYPCRQGGRVYVKFSDQDPNANKLAQGLLQGAGIGAPFDIQQGDVFDPTKVPGHVIPAVHISFPDWDAALLIKEALVAAGIKDINLMSGKSGRTLQFPGVDLDKAKPVLDAHQVLDKLKYSSLQEEESPFA